MPVSHKAKQSGAQKRKRAKVKRIVFRTLLYIFTVLLLVVFGVYAMLNVAFNGPSTTAADVLTESLLESSALKFVPYIFYTDERVEQIKQRNSVVTTYDEVDTSLITFTQAENAKSQTEEGPDIYIEDDIRVEEIKGATYQGWMMIVKDPSRVFVGVSTDYFTDNQPGLLISELADKYNAVGAVNGGAFSDSNGQGNGGMAEGLTISEGKIMNTYVAEDFTTVGFDENNVLVIGNFSRAQAEEKHIRDAVSFGPALIINGEPAKTSGASSGLNPRTAIGQCADGSVLLLVIDGRQVNSLGASYADLIEIMLRYGAVNACNLDGGTSSNMVYEGEMLNTGAPIIGARHIPTAVLVR